MQKIAVIAAAALTFKKAGKVDVECAIHPGMK